MIINPELKPRIIKAMGALMKIQSKPDCGFNLDDPEEKSMLMRKKGGFSRERSLHNGQRMVVKVKWDKAEMLFACSIAFLKKQPDGKWHCDVRFDDAHDCRHCDIDLPLGKTKMFGGYAEIKAQCPILIQIIKSLPQEKADEWKLKLFKEIVVGNQRWKEYLSDLDQGKGRIWH